MVFSENKIRSIISFLRWFYLLVAIIGFLSIAGYYVLNKKILAVDAIYLFVNIIFFIGLRYRKPWVVPLILLFSSIGLINHFLTFPTTVLLIIVKVLAMALDVFLIYFCTKKEVRVYFGTKGIFLFSR